MSSDSDDDCYGNVAQKLQQLKSTYEKKTESCNLLDTTDSFSKSVDTSITVEDYIPKNDPTTSLLESDGEEISLDAIIAQNSKRKQTRNAKRSADISQDIILVGRIKRTRASARTGLSNNSDIVVPNNENGIEPSIPNTSKSRGRGRGKRGRQTTRSNSTNAVNNTENIANNTVSPNSSTANTRSTTRGRGRRARGRRGNSRRRCWTLEDYFDSDSIYEDYIPHEVRQVQAQLPTYSVGNTHEYPDQSYNQQLFSNKPAEVVQVEDNESLNDSLDENEELSVKVHWRSSEFHKFAIRRFQKLTQIFNFFAEREGVSQDKLLFMYNDKILKVDDTPDSITYSIAKFIEGGVTSKSLAKIVQKDENHVQKSGLKIKFQCQDVKKPFETVIQAEDKMQLAMTMCAEHFEKALDKMKFYFDGDLISGKNTAKELELEGGECIDVKILS